MIPYGLHDIDEDDIKEVVKVLQSDWITTGPKIGELETALSRYIGCSHAVLANSGTSALDIAVGALELPKKSEVITTPFSFVATSNSLIYNELKPVFADIDRKTRNISPDSIADKITKNTKAISFVDFAGHPCDIKAIRDLAHDHNLVLIDDACHALGAEYNNEKIGTLADVTILSFHPVKHITTGEGGAVTTSNPELFKRMTLLRSHGIDRDAGSRFGKNASWAYDMKMLGRNYRMTDFQAALGISQLKKLDTFIEKRQKLADKYLKALREIPWITLPVTLPGVRHAWHIFTVLLNEPVKRDDFFRYMRSADIGVNVHYIPIYRHSYYQHNFPVKTEDFPVTEDVFRRIITLPLHPKLSPEDSEHIVNTIAAYKV